ncbi:MAG: hypothetical protein ACOC91_02360 [bacterium]
MRHQHWCSAGIMLWAALLGGGFLTPADAVSTGLERPHNDAVLVINMRTYRWDIPEFRMAGNDAYMVVQVENAHSYPVEIYVSCRTRDGLITDMTGQYTIPPRKFLRLDTRRTRGPLQEGEGVRVKCRFRADGSADVKAWVYDKEA